VLYLTGANRTLEGRKTPADMDDGVLTAYEATQLNLQGTELVVLSACETGLGESQNGEGVFGLRRALQEAGAETVLMSMWSVPDQETQELMTLFYRRWLGGKDKHEALREAQSELRATVRARYGRDLAYYWGAFVLVGRQNCAMRNRGWSTGGGGIQNAPSSRAAPERGLMLGFQSRLVLRIMLCLCAAGATAVGLHGQTRRALLIGINTYQPEGT